MPRFNSAKGSIVPNSHYIHSVATGGLFANEQPKQSGKKLDDRKVVTALMTVRSLLRTLSIW